MSCWTKHIKAVRPQANRVKNLLRCVQTTAADGYVLAGTQRGTLLMWASPAVPAPVAGAGRASASEWSRLESEDVANVEDFLPAGLD